MVFCGFEKAWFIIVLHKTCSCQSVTCNLATLALVHLQQVQPMRHIVAQEVRSTKGLTSIYAEN